MRPADVIHEGVKRKAACLIIGMDQAPVPFQDTPGSYHDVVGDLHHPPRSRLEDLTGSMYVIAGEAGDKQHIVGYQHAPGPDLRREKVGGHEHVHVETDEFPPSRGLLPLRGRWDAMTLENVPDRLVTDRVT